MSAVDDVITFQAPWVKGDAALPDSTLGAAERELIDRLSGAFDAAVIFTVCTQSALPAALLCRMAGIPLRLAYSRENPYGLLSDWIAEPDTVRDGMRHEVLRQLALVGAVGWRTDDERLRLHVAQPPRQRVCTMLRDAGIAPERRYFVVHPGASAASRRYPAARFGAAADAIAAHSGCLPIFTGEATDAALIDEARRCMTQPSIALAGRLRVPELAALIDGAQLLLANNTGPAHIAAAMDTKVVVLYAMTNPQHTPWQVAARVLNHDVPCRHCLKSVCPQGHHDCLLRVPADAVADAAMELLQAAGVDAPAHQPQAGSKHLTTQLQGSTA
jgi:ADP-heptose:LPS heptosyltransferase